MSDEQETASSLSYLDELTGGSRAVMFPGLVSTPNLEATLRLHREYKKRITQDTDVDWDGNVTYDHTDVVWGSAYEEMSHALLMASEIAGEIKKGLGLLGVDWTPALNGMFLPPTSDEMPNVIRCPPQFAVPEAELDMTIRQAVEIVCFFSGLGEDWVAEEVHAYGESCVDEGEGIYVTTLDEHYVSCPELPVISGLRDWNEVSDGLEEEGYLIDGDALIEDCLAVLTGIVERILEGESRR